MMMHYKKIKPGLFVPLFLTGFCFLFPVSCKTINAAPDVLPPGVVVFSFDDEPNAHENVTIKLLAVLEKNNIRACFSILGVNADHNPSLVKRIAAGGHRIINHGYGEKWAVFMDKNAFKANLLEGERAIYDALASTDINQSDKKQPALDIPAYRPHGGFYKKTQQQCWEEEGYKMMPCTIRIHDAVLSEKDKKKALTRIIKQIEKQNGGIILLHDARDSYTTMETRLAKKPHGKFNRAWIPAFVDEVIIILQEKNYRISGFDPFEIPGVLSSTRSIP